MGPMDADSDVNRDMRGQSQSRPDERAVAELAARQYGVVSHAQLCACGLSTDGIDRRISAGRLHVLHRGVYAVGHSRISGSGHWMAAVLACGSTAILSHRSAAAHWDLRRTDSRLVDVTA